MAIANGSISLSAWQYSTQTLFGLVTQSPPRGEAQIASAKRLPVSGRLNAWQRRKQLKVYFIRCLYVMEIVSPSDRWLCIIRLQRLQKQTGKQTQQTNKQKINAVSFVKKRKMEKKCLEIASPHPLIFRWNKYSLLLSKLKRNFWMWDPCLITFESYLQAQLFSGIGTRKLCFSPLISAGWAQN